MRKFVVFGLVNLLTFISLVAQNQNTEIKTFKKATISLVDYQRIEAINVILKKDSLIFDDAIQGGTLVIETSKVNYLNVSDGTYFGKGALYGGLFMGVMCLSASMQTPNKSNDFVPITFGLIGGGILLGGLIGAMVPKNYTYFINDKYSHIDLKTDIVLAESFVGVKFSLSF